MILFSTTDRGPGLAAPAYLVARLERDQSEQEQRLESVCRTRTAALLHSACRHMVIAA